MLNVVAFAEVTTKIEINNVEVTFTESSGAPFIDTSSRTQVPFRVSLETFGATVSWDNTTKTAIAVKDGVEVKVPIGQKYILRNDVTILTDTEALIKDGRTYLPIRAVMEAFGMVVGWDSETKTVTVNQPEELALTNIGGEIKVGDTVISVLGYQIDLTSSAYKIHTALANNFIGSVDTLENIATANNALIAVNGSYFAAYTDDRDPYGILVVDGKIVHNANDRATIGFKNNQIDIDFVDTTIKGANGTPEWKYSWNGYWLNHTVIEGGISLTIYDSYRGDETRSSFGRNYVVKDGLITEIVENQSVPIPPDGYVANLYGELGEGVYERFQIGYPFEYAANLVPESGNSEFWNTLDGATGAGPALIIDGQIQIDFDKENFYEAKIKTESVARSAIGYKSDGKLIIINTTATIHELAEIMKELGCYEAMNLDGGASSGLYFEGNMIRTPGREISNIIYIK